MDHPHPLVHLAHPEPQPRLRARELAMSAAWHGGLTRNLETAAGETLSVVFRGHWSHGFGPDFTDAIIAFGTNDLRTGSVEIHRLAGDWVRHGHHIDPRYNDVILHVVSRIDTADTRREDGALVPTVVLNVPEEVLFAIDQDLPGMWEQLGGSVCAADLAARRPELIVEALRRLGDQRFTARTMRLEAELTDRPVEAVMLDALFDGFGYAYNRPAMRLLYERLVESGCLGELQARGSGQPWIDIAAMLYGLGGFLPLSPGDAHMAALSPEAVADMEGRWASRAGWLSQWTMPATMWTRARTRPANHPAARLAALGALLASTGGQPGALLASAVRDGVDSAGLLQDLTGGGPARRIGHDRATALAASVVLPALMAWAQHADDSDLEDAVARAWAALPRAGWSRPARRALEQVAGGVPFRLAGERANQGLLHLDRTLCTPRRCYECPIAAEVILDRQRTRQAPTATRP